ncbi:hypothetical protein [Halomonas alkalisoli]|uniref:hypothetical protein n=1 Tax=Halomonas alkalisoli TaxID=2907158 RepID=UPI001F3A7BB3|nr:hypothetical protein [Halomonas alkalisoli]MCE9684006.1 hypothetical protein [Halomonas alkalisoli]
MAENDFDYEGYEKSLERSLALTEKDYWSQYIDVNRHQVNVAKTYLWVAAALLGAYTTIVARYSYFFIGNVYVSIFGVVTILAAVFAFGICLYAIPARKGYKAIPDISWGEFPAYAHQSLSKKNRHVYIDLLTDINNKIDKANYHNVATNQKRANLLRKTSWVLVVSFSFALLTGASSLIATSIRNVTPSKEAVMPEDNETQSQPQNQGSESKPDVPTPAGPISGGNPDMSTHSQDIPTSSNVRITESDKDGAREE